MNLIRVNNVLDRKLKQIKCEPVSYHIPLNIDHYGFYHIMCEPMFLVADNSLYLNMSTKPSNEDKASTLMIVFAMRKISIAVYLLIVLLIDRFFLSQSPI